MNKISKQFMGCFLIILILPITFFSWAGLNNYKKIYVENILERERIFLEKTCSVLEKDLENLEALAFYSSQQDYLARYELKKRTDYRKIREAFRSEIATHSFLSGIHYYNPVTEDVIYTDSGNLSLKYYAQFYGMEDEEAVREFLRSEEMVGLEKVESPRYGRQNRYVIRHANGQVWMFYLSEGYLEQVLAYEDACTALWDKNGNLLYEVTDVGEADQEQPGRKKMGRQLMVEPDAGNYVLTRQIAEAVLLYEVAKWQRGFLTMILFLLILGGVLVMVFTFYNVKPIRRMQSWYEEQAKQTAKNRKEALLLAQLLIGHENRTEQFKNAVTEAGILKKADCFRVILVTAQRETVQEWNKIRMCLLDSLKGEIYPVELSSNRSLVLLAGLQEKEEAALKEDLLACVREIEESYGIRLICYVGSRQQELDLVTVSWHEALDRFYKKQTVQEQVVYCEPLQETAEFQYPELEMEALYSALIDVDLEKADLLTDLLIDLFRQQKENHAVRMSLYYDIVNMYYSAYMQLKWDAIAVFQNEQLLGRQKESEKLDTIELLRRQFREYAERRKGAFGDNENIIDKVIRFIDENEEYPELCVNMVADRFGISISNLSHQFKKQTGNTISIYIRDKKFLYAARLLRETNETVQQVGCMVGYTQTNNFVKIFRQYYDMTPAEYRRQNRLPESEEKKNI